MRTFRLAGALACASAVDADEDAAPAAGRREPGMIGSLDILGGAGLQLIEP